MKRILLLGLLLMVGLACPALAPGEDEDMSITGGGKFGLDNDDEVEIELYDDENETEVEEETEEETEEELEDETEEPGEREREREQEGDGRGIAAQVHQIIQERKNGTLEVPQGQVVRIVAQNREVYAGNESIPLNATLRVRLRVQEQEHVLAFNGTEEEEEIEIEENGTKVRTRETVRITSNKMLIGDNQSEVVILPYGLQQKLRLRNVTQAMLHVEDGKPYYEVNGTRKGKLLWLFDVELPIQAQVHAETGVVEKEQGPWWSFLVATE